MVSVTFAAAALFAGVMSFLSPCVLPLVPGYLSLVSGVGAQQLREGHASRPALLRHGLMFVLGFSLVFVSFGAVASSIGQLMARHVVLLNQVAGVVIVVFGLHLTRVLPLQWLYANQQFEALFGRQGPWGALLVGLAFGFGWMPCVGPILASILTLAASEATLAKGVSLLSFYALGLALPFLIASLAIGHFLAVYQRLRRHLPKLEVAGGTLLVAVGILVFTRHLTVVNAWLNDIAVLRSVGEHFL